jgi:NAD(P)H-hydrate epimerase
MKFKEGLRESDAILDAVFGAYPHFNKAGWKALMTGFSFAPPVRKPFDTVLTAMKESGLPILSVDIPSGWHVEDGPQVSDIRSSLPYRRIS